MSDGARFFIGPLQMGVEIAEHERAAYYTVNISDVHMDYVFTSSPALAAVARWLAEPGNSEALVDLLQWDLEHSFPRIDVEQRMRSLLAALEEAA